MNELISVSVIQGDLFTTSSLGTLAGAIAAVYIICSTLQAVFNFNPKWLALLVSVLVSYTGAYLSTSSDGEVSKYIVALFNGFLIYTSATGTNQIIGTKPEIRLQKSAVTVKHILKRQFDTTWW